MEINWFRIASGTMQAQSALFEWAKVPQVGVEYWIDVRGAEPGELRDFLGPLGLHSLLLDRCLDQDISPGVLVYGSAALMEYPAGLDRVTAEPTYLTILMQTPYLITVHHGPMPALDELVLAFTAEHAPQVDHLAQIFYQILDVFTDSTADIQTAIRDQILGMQRTLADNPAGLDAKQLTTLRRQVGNLISLVENQLYCVSNLAASDFQDLQEPHRSAYIQDLVGEAEIAQRGAYRLEGQLKDLFSDYQMIGSDRVEKRLRLLTIVSAVTLPLGLIAGLLGMNVGGVPGINEPSGFKIVIALMAVITLALAIYFRQKGWFD